MLPQVIKRDGSSEKFSIINVAKVVQATGLTPEQAKSIAEKIASWVESTNEPTLTSIKIRDKVIQELEKINTNAADLYKWYEQSKEK